MSRSPHEQTTPELKCRAVELLAIGVIPFEQWANVFANPQFLSLNGLRAKAFAVWFSTMADFLKGEADWTALRNELDKRSEPYADAFERIFALAEHFRLVLTLYSIDDQIFLRDRRLQNVHGRLHIYAQDEHEIPIFDLAVRKVIKIDKSASEYREIMGRYYPRLGERSKELIDRLLSSREFADLTAYYKAKLEVATNLAPLIDALGVGASVPLAEPANKSLERTHEE
jgi:hypothetical protein